MSDKTPTLRFCTEHSVAWPVNHDECDVSTYVLVSADDTLWRIDPKMHPHYDSPWFLDELEDWKRWGVLVQVYPNG